MIKPGPILKDLGFTDGEIKVYTSLFEIGETSVGPISKQSGVTHAKVYPILDKLIKKGLVSHVLKEGTKHFAATHPNSLLEFVNKKVRSLEEEKESINKIIPSLLAKQKEKEKTQYSRVFEGMKGLRALFYELFSENKKKTEICVFGMNEVLKQPRFKSFFNWYHPMRAKHNITLKLILKKHMAGHVKDNPQYSPPNKVKLVNMIYPTGVFIFKDHVINIVVGEKVTAFDTKSELNAKRYKEYFNSIWEKIR